MIDMFESAVNTSKTLRGLSALTQIMLAGRLIKSGRLHPRLSFITDTLELATNQLQPFLFIFILLLVVFASAGKILFGAPPGTPNQHNSPGCFA